MDAIGFFFDNLLINPMLNIIVMLYSLLFSNFGLAIIVFTIIVRIVTLPLHVRQIKQMRAMSEMQPRMKQIQEIKDPGERTRAMQAMWREAGVNPLGCLGPLVIQMLVWVALFRVLIKSLGTNPDDLVGLAQRLYSWNPFSDVAIPLNPDFLWLDLAAPDPTNIVLPVLVGASTWLQQKMTMTPSADPRQAQTNKMMLWMMPIMLGFITLTFPSGLAVYWTVSNVAGVLIQYFITGDWGPLFAKDAPQAQPILQAASEEESKENESDGDGTGGPVRKNRRRSRRDGPERARRKPGRGRNRGPKPR